MRDACEAGASALSMREYVVAGRVLHVQAARQPIQFYCPVHSICMHDDDATGEEPTLFIPPFFCKASHPIDLHLHAPHQGRSMVSMAAAAKIAVLLAATALFAAAGAADPQPPQPGKESQCWQCYSSCIHKCDNSSSGEVQKYFQCKKSCILDCYKELPPVCFKMCISQTCLTLPQGAYATVQTSNMRFTCSYHITSTTLP